MKDASSAVELKKAAALRASSLVESGMLVGLGTGSTTAFVLEELGRRVREENLKIECGATSFQAMLLGRKEGLLVHPLMFLERFDISIDGADEIDPQLNLIKGGGGAQTLEKLVHSMSEKFIVVADESKLVKNLGEIFSVPVEILPPAAAYAKKKLTELGASSCSIRMGLKKDGPVVTENGNLLLDAKFAVKDAEKLETQINEITGIVENGIFSRKSIRVNLAIIAGSQGLLEIKGAV